MISSVVTLEAVAEVQQLKVSDRRIQLGQPGPLSSFPNLYSEVIWPTLDISADKGSPRKRFHDFPFLGAFLMMFEIIFYLFRQI